MADPIPARARTVCYTPPALAERDPKPLFHLKIPTPDDRDTLSSTLFRIGIRAVTQEVVRATIVDELYTLFDEAKAEEKAVLLDTFWQTNEADSIAFQNWQEQEIERQRDEFHGAPPTDPAPMPMAITRPRDKARARLIIEEVTSGSPRMQTLLERKMNFGRENAFGLVRLGLEKVENWDARFALPPMTGVLTAEEVHALRASMPDAAWAQLIETIEAGYMLEEEERKNSGWPHGKPSGPTGSPAPNDEPEIKDGSATGSSIEPAPSAESATTTG